MNNPEIMNAGGEILIMPLNEENFQEEDTERRDEETTNLGQTTFLPSERPQPVAFLCWTRSLALIHGNY